jgi:hypothetical protein
MDYGFQLGGPIFKNRLWFWLGAGVQDIRQLTIDGYPMNSKLYNFNAKLNAQLNDKNRAELAFYVPLKYVDGAGAGARRAFWSFWPRTPTAGPSVIPMPTCAREKKPERFFVSSTSGSGPAASFLATWSSTPG